MNSMIIKSTKDLYGRNAVELVQSLTPFKSNIYLNIEGRRVNLKSILGLLSAGVRKETTIKIEILEDDELEEIHNTIKKFFN